MPLSADDAWLLIDNALKDMKSCQLLSVRKQRRVLHALGALNASPPEAAHLHQPCSPSRQKRRKFYGFLRTVLHTCGPYGVLVAAIGLTQTIVSGMTNYQRNALCEKLASHKDWQLPDSPHLQSFVVQLRTFRSVYSMFSYLKFKDNTDREVQVNQEKGNSGHPYWVPSESLHAGGHDMDQTVDGHEIHDTTRHFPPSLKGTRHIMWVGIPGGPQTIKHNPYLHVPVCFKDLEIFEETNSPFQALSKGIVDNLRVKLGPWFLEYDNDKSRNVAFIHQSILMMLFAAHLSGATVEFYNWETDEEAFTHKALASNNDQTLIFISDTSCDETVESVYRVTNYLEAVRANVRVYPKRSEWSWCQQKVGDVRTLDDVARVSNTWRPKTCFGMGECLLTQPQDGQMVLKRSHSCAGREVKVVSMTNRANLLCKAPVADQTAKRVRRGRHQGARLHKFLYFHQEYVPTFRSTGEFRVWVCGGRVVCAFRTKDDDNSPGKPMALRQLDMDDYSDFNWYSSDKGARRRMHDELLQFVIDTDCRIRRLRNDEFDTVEIGARYDCGISPDHRFYVNELTRFTNADTFSGLLAPPHDQIIGPLAKMIAQKLLT